MSAERDPNTGSTGHFLTPSHLISIVTCNPRIQLLPLMIKFSKTTERVQDEARAAGQSDSTVCFLSYNTRLILCLKQPHTDLHAERAGFYSLGVGKISLTMTQTLEAIK